MKKFTPRIWITAALLALLVAFVVQNNQTVSLKLLWMHLSMPRSVLIALVLLIGYVLGRFAAFRQRRRGP